MVAEQKHHLSPEHWDLEEKSPSKLQEEYAQKIGSQRFWTRTEFWGFAGVITFVAIGFPALAGFSLSTGIVADFMRARVNPQVQAIREELKIRGLVLANAT